MKQKRVLVAGGAGFLGLNIVKCLATEGNQVVVIDNYATSRPSFQNYWDELKNIEVIEHDIVDALPDMGMFDVVINLACPASPPRYQQLALETLEVNSIGTQHLLELARRDHARFLQASTSEVYGNPLEHPQTESYWGNVNSYGPRSMYDEGKRYAEALIWVYRSKWKVNTGIIRIFNTYGSGMQYDDGRVITNFLYQALHDQPLTIYGEGSQTRSFCAVNDQVSGWMKMINAEMEGPVNIGNPKEFQISDLVSVIERLLGKKLNISYKPLPEDDPLQRRPDISLAKEQLEWQPTIELEDGLAMMLNWIEEFQPEGWI